jgi:hypothetical protein
MAKTIDTTGGTFYLTCDADASVRGCPCPGSRRWRQAKVGCRKRGRHRVNGGQDARSERPALGAGQARTQADRVNYWMLPVVNADRFLRHSSPSRVGRSLVPWSARTRAARAHHMPAPLAGQPRTPSDRGGLFAARGHGVCVRGTARADAGRAGRLPPAARHG